MSESFRVTGPVRKLTRQVLVRGIPIGGGAPVTVQAMTKTDTRDVEATCRQVLSLAEQGASIVRLAVPDDEAASALFAIRSRVDCPLVADIHFDHRLALRSLEAGVDKLRINPGNLGGRENLSLVAREARSRGVPLRVGVNAGSLERDILERHGGPSARAIAESALRNVGYLRDLGFGDIVVSAKSSDVRTCVDAYRMVSSECDLPLHVGITETGPGLAGIVKSAAGIGALLLEGIGDTIRVSLTAAPEEEVLAAKLLLRSLGLQGGPDIVSCPTCGRVRGPVMEIASRVALEMESVERPLKVAVMGCEVNGPGEAREADIGMALARNGAVLFCRGQVVRTGALSEVLSALVRMARKEDDPCPETKRSS
jgi:(E)-4-hydroxy-3-methylbut-2-enyl-diphosphate synthase